MAGGTIRLLPKRVNTESLLFTFFWRRRLLGPAGRKVSAKTAARGQKSHAGPRSEKREGPRSQSSESITVESER